MGAFDTDIDMSGNALAPGTYENYRSNFGLSQLLQSGGVQVFGGYRTGFGDFPTYNLSQKTADVGEFRGGITMPLVHDRDIDGPRAGRDKARLDRAIAEPTIVRTRLDFMRAAALTYWLWSGSGEQVFGNQDAGFGKSGLSGIDGLEFTFDSVRAGPRPVPGPAGR